MSLVNCLCTQQAFPKSTTLAEAATTRSSRDMASSGAVRASVSAGAGCSVSRLGCGCCLHSSKAAPQSDLTMYALVLHCAVAATGCTAREINARQKAKSAFDLIRGLLGMHGVLLIGSVAKVCCLQAAVAGIGVYVSST